MPFCDRIARVTSHLIGNPMSSIVHTVQLNPPYLLFLGEETHPLKAKTAFGLRDWARERCAGQMHAPGGSVDLGLPELNPEQARAVGIRSLLIGVTPVGGRIPAHWTPILLAAVEAGLDIISGLHNPLASVPGLAAAAARNDARLIDVRLPPPHLPRATGKKRSGMRAAMVGTDCALGKKYTALALAGAMRVQGIDADFRASGQTGIMIAGEGIAVDAVVADFIAGAAECISPEAAPDHWDLVEGQGSLFHPAYAAVTLGLLHGSQPDALVLCHDAMRTHAVSWPDYPLPSLREAEQLYLQMARRTNSRARLAAVSLNTSALSLDAAQEAIERVEKELGVPAFDPMRTPLEPIVAAIVG